MKFRLNLKTNSRDERSTQEKCFEMRQPLTTTEQQRECTRASLFLRTLFRPICFPICATDYRENALARAFRMKPSKRLVLVEYPSTLLFTVFTWNFNFFFAICIEENYFEKLLQAQIVCFHDYFFYVIRIEYLKNACDF